MRRHTRHRVSPSASPMTGSAKQSIKQQESKSGLLRRVAMTHSNSSVVPANAGTHNHRRLWLRKVSTNVPNTNGTAYGSRRSPGRRKMMQIVKQQTHVRGLAAPCARAVDKSSAQRGRGERQVPVAPAASRALCIGRTHTSNNEYTETPGIPARNGFNGFLRALPGDHACLSPSPTD